MCDTTPNAAPDITPGVAPNAAPDTTPDAMTNDTARTSAKPRPFSIPAVLSIAGSDSSGGAGIQADIKTIAAHGLFAECAITALTAQNTLGVTAVEEATPDFVAAQIDAVFEDIPPAAVKIGMVSSANIIATIAKRLEHWHAAYVVVDPVMVATSGARLINDNAVDALTNLLFPLAEIITPNMPEAEALLGQSIHTEEDQAAAAVALAQAYSCAVLVKGGHATNDAADALATPDSADVTWFRRKRIETANTHGTGCTLSSAIACGLAEGKPLHQAVGAAKAYLTGALTAGLNLGHGSGPIDHMWALRDKLQQP